MYGGVNQFGQTIGQTIGGPFGQFGGAPMGGAQPATFVNPAAGGGGFPGVSPQAATFTNPVLMGAGGGAAAIAGGGPGTVTGMGLSPYGGVPPTVSAQYGNSATKRRNQLKNGPLYPSGETDPVRVEMPLGVPTTYWGRHPIYRRESWSDINLPRRGITRLNSPDVPVNAYENMAVQERQNVQNILTRQTSLDFNSAAAVAQTIAPDPGNRFTVL
eukprot:NODE_296_length_1002_cov_1497.667429_g289_i0.p1 GENE.NODE_296_length_1002_cov_1497.667429_g289_i0~~NODE_296_length_1002_cov_1497.667429_g289_i0.p1  ORF type:complete len:215 (+),score=60.00 NODE_296_length_1002_cov_1497.667429_g289_i0:144-788(+)